MNGMIFVGIAIVIASVIARAAVTYEKKIPPITEPKGIVKIAELEGVGPFYRFESVEGVCFIVPTGISCL